MLHALFGMPKARKVWLLRNGPPNGPAGFLVSATRHGVTGTKRRPRFAPCWLKVAVTVCVAFMVTEQVSVPEHAPPQPAKVEPPAGVAVSVTTVPLLKLAKQVAPQLMEPTLLVTTPAPVPCLVIDSAKVWACCVKVAVTVCAAFIVTEQVRVPEQAPPHPVKIEPPAGVAVSVTTVPLLKLAKQVAPQLMKPSLRDTVPAPGPWLGFE